MKTKLLALLTALLLLLSLAACAQRSEAPSSRTASSVSSEPESSAQSSGWKPQEEPTFLGKPVSQVDFSSAVDSYRTLSGNYTEVGEYIHNLCADFFWALSFRDYPLSPEEEASLSDIYLLNFVYNRYREGYNGKQLEDYPIYKQEGDGFLIWYELPLSEVLDCLLHFFPELNRSICAKILTNGDYYLPEKDACFEPIGIGGGLGPWVIMEVTLESDYGLSIVFHLLNDPINFQSEDFLSVVQKKTSYEGHLKLQLVGNSYRYLSCQYTPANPA